MPSTFSAQQFFETQRPPANLDQVRAQAVEFVQRQRQAGRNVVLVTSGGTTVPLEQNVVRFLDNFSAGTRGATSAEYFLSAGYAVIFMHRQHSLSPFTRHYSHTTNPFLDLLADPNSEREDAGASQEAEGSGAGRAAGEASGSTASRKAPPSSTTEAEQKIYVRPEHCAQLRPVLAAYHDANRAGTLLRVSFVTVNDYLFMLREMSHAMQPLGRSAMYYLAAAVSDFFVPSTKTPEHKIQSGKGSLLIEMDQVPKVLKPMVQDWVPEGFIVSFKLETDPTLLIPKARGALERYGHQVVVGNDLNRRKFEVVFVQRNLNAARSPNLTASSSPDTPQGSPTNSSSPVAGYTERWIRLADKPAGAASSSSSAPATSHTGEREIEEDIVRELCSMHSQWIAQGANAGPRM